MKNWFLVVIALVGFTTSAMFVSCGSKDKDSQTSLAQLEQGWHNPPQMARPRVWWHWMNGNITKEGIRKDLQWMKDIGLAGFHNFDASSNTPIIVDKRLVYMDEGWQEAFGVAARTADSLGLEMTIASSPGWSTTGGPWVEPEDAMKKLTWRTLLVEGGKLVSCELPAPFKTTGAFQDGPFSGRGFSASQYEHYEDIAVMAVKQPAGYQTLSELGARISSSGGKFTLEQLTNGSISDNVLLPSGAQGYAWIAYEFPQPQTVKAITLADGTMGGPGGARPARAFLESSEDGITFTRVAPLPGGGVSQRTLTVPPTTARYFRVVFDNPVARGGRGGMGFGGPVAPPKGTQIAELELHLATRVNYTEDKAGFSAKTGLADAITPASSEAFPSMADVLDITDKVMDGKLDWEAPEGRWMVYRFGWSLTGKQNHPAPVEATGLEVDKLDPKAWTKFFHTYFDMYKKASGGLLGDRGVQYVLNDSYEAEQENWTPAMFQEFRARRGYDLHPWLPVLTGQVMVSPEVSDAFLWDWRMTIGDLITANYDLLTDIAQKDYGMKGRYTESHEAARVYVVDGMDVKRTSQVPMSAMWVSASWLPDNPDGTPNRTIYNLDGLESASVAHIYGQNVAAAESMTAPGGEHRSYAYHPGNLKFLADLEMSNGTNIFVIHESAHQPSDAHVPGLSLGNIGQWFNRHDAWAPMAGMWVDYMARSCFILQSGKNVADLLLYYGEDNNIIGVYGNTMPEAPAGYRYDFASPDVLLNQVSPDRKGNLVAKSGVSYKVLWLDKNVDYMSVGILRRLAEFADAGVVICGNKPTRKAGLDGTQEEFDTLVNRIWNSGKANVTCGKPVTEVMASVIDKDFIPEGTSEFRFLHRTMPGVEIYWVNKPSTEYETVKASFRVSGKKPQLWHPESGAVEDVTYEVKNGRTLVTLPMAPDDAVFVVFSGKGASRQTIPAATETTLLTVDTPWTVKFQEKRGAPAEAVFGKLESYTENEDTGIKYFSGIATYTNAFTCGPVQGKVMLDLGTVADLAEVYVNGQYCGSAWKEPYKVDITSAVKDGANQLEVKIANVWVNRLIGDEQPGATRIAYTDSRSGYRAESKLNPAGLLGPVSLLEIK